MQENGGRLGCPGQDTSQEGQGACDKRGDSPLLFCVSSGLPPGSTPSVNEGLGVQLSFQLVSWRLGRRPGSTGRLVCGLVYPEREVMRVGPRRVSGTEKTRCTGETPASWPGVRQVAGTGHAPACVSLEWMVGGWVDRQMDGSHAPPRQAPGRQEQAGRGCGVASRKGVAAGCRPAGSKGAGEEGGGGGTGLRSQGGCVGGPGRCALPTGGEEATEDRGSEMA